jgi:hypothetical protein
MRYSLFCLLMAITLCSCKKDHTTPGNLLEVYVLQSFQLVNGKCQIDAATAILESQPTVFNDDILEYSKSQHEFKLNDAAFQRIRNFHDWTPFAVTVDRNAIYYGFFKPSISSSSCEHSITMDIASFTEKKILLRLGYPGTSGTGIDDQRNNPLLIATLKKQGKLQ